MCPSWLPAHLDALVCWLRLHLVLGRVASDWAWILPAAGLTGVPAFTSREDTHAAFGVVAFAALWVRRFAGGRGAPQAP